MEQPPPPCTTGDGRQVDGGCIQHAHNSRDSAASIDSEMRAPFWHFTNRASISKYEFVWFFPYASNAAA